MERLKALERRIDDTIVHVEDLTQADGSKPRIKIFGSTEVERLIAALEKRFDKLDVRVKKPAESRLDNLKKIEIERIVAAEGKRLYGNDWLKITERR
jgi:hypothetical protein